MLRGGLSIKEYGKLHGRFMRSLEKRHDHMRSTKCIYCKKYLENWERTIEHLVPISRGGPQYLPENMVIACAPCNSTRSSLCSTNELIRLVEQGNYTGRGWKDGRRLERLFSIVDTVENLIDARGLVVK